MLACWCSIGETMPIVECGPRGRWPVYLRLVWVRAAVCWRVWARVVRRVWSVSSWVSVDKNDSEAFKPWPSAPRASVVGYRSFASIARPSSNSSGARFAASGSASSSRLRLRAALGRAPSHNDAPETKPSSVRPWRYPAMQRRLVHLQLPSQPGHRPASPDLVQHHPPELRRISKRHPNTS